MELSYYKARNIILISTLRQRFPGWGSLTSKLMMRLRYAVRSLAKSPLLSLVVVLSLGLGIGAQPCASGSSTPAGSVSTPPAHFPKDCREPPHSCGTNFATLGSGANTTASFGRPARERTIRLRFHSTSVPGDHREMLTGDNAAVIARHLVARLETIRPAQRAASA